jgi:hypothetical protein
MKTKFADTFFDSFKRMVNRQRWYWKTYDLFRYDLPNFFRNLWLFRKNLWNHTWYNGDGSILPWVKTAVDDMVWKIETRGHEVEESRMKKVAKMKRLSYLIDVCVHDTFIEEAEKELGMKMIYHEWEFKEVTDEETINLSEEKEPTLYELVDKDTPEEKEHNRKILERSYQIQKEYWEELCYIIKGPDYDLIRETGEDFYEKLDGSDIRGWWD